MFNVIKAKIITALSVAMILSGCASEPITVLKTRYGVLVKEHQITKSENSTLATVGGAAAGGLLGNQFGGGSGKTAATVVGVLAGGAAGSSLSTKNVTYYEYTVYMNDGEKFLLETGKKRKTVGNTVVVEHLSTGRERINVIP